MKVNPNPAPSMGGLMLACVLLLCCLVNSEAQTINLGLSTRRTLKSDFWGYDMSTTIRNNVSCIDPTLHTKTGLLNPKSLRFPAGGNANWYDWKQGWFVDNVYLPDRLKQPKIPNGLEDFKGLWHDSGAPDYIIDLNMLTSTLKDQIAMLKHLDSINMPVKYIELGNEFYLEDGEDDDSALILIKYPTPSSYGDTATIWIDTIKKYFPNAMIAAQGNFDKNAVPRRVIWNDSVLAHLEGEDAMTFHFYYTTHYSDSTETDADKLNVNAGDIPDWIYQPFKAWSVLKSKSLPKVRPGKEVWITEYNLSDHVRPVMGMWGHGLYTATMALQLLNDDRITKIDCHGVDGMAVYGAYFFSTSGFNFATGEDPNFVAPAIKPPTTLWGLTAYGNTLTMMGTAINNKTYASPIVFTQTPKLFAIEDGDTGYYDGIIGYLFNDASSSQAIILNLTSTTQSIKTNILFPAGGTYETRYAPFLNLIATASDVSTNSGNLPITMTLQPYSITRISSNFVPAAPPTANIVPSGPTTFCNGDSVVLDAGAGYYSYTWSTGATTRKITVKSSGSFWVHAYAVQAGYYGADTVQVIVHDNPITPNITPAGNKKFCFGGSVVLQLGSAYNCPGCTYYWPLTGTSGTSTTVTTTSNQYMVVTDVNGCKAVSDTESITAWPLPVVSATPVGPTSACYDVGVSLQATSGFQSYEWSNGGFGQTKVFTASGSYYVTATDINNCHGNSNSVPVTVWEPPLPSVTALGPTTFCVENPTYLTTISGYQYQWIKGVANVTGATNQNYAPTSTAGYKVKITDSHNCSKNSNSFNVTVNSVSAPAITAPGGVTFCQGESTQLNEATGYSGYLWSTGQTTPSITVTTGGSYTVTITNSNGCTSTSAPKVITVNPLPTPDITINGPSQVCSGQTVSLSAPAGYNQYTWSNGKSGQTVTADNSGAITVTVKDGNNCYGTSSPVNVTVWNPPTPTIATNTGATTFCNNTGVYLTTLSGYNYQWQKGTANISGGTDQNYTPTSGGSYKVIITDVHGCTKTSSPLTLVVNSSPNPIVNGSSAICQGSSTTLTTGTFSAYTWSTGSHSSSINVSAAGNYSVTVTDGNGCVATSAVKSISVNPLPTPTISAQGATSFCSGGSVVLDAGSGYSSYSWSSNKSTQTINPNSSGNYTVTVTNSNGCAGTSAPTNVTVWSPPVPTISTNTGAIAFCDNIGVYLTTSVSGYNYQWQKTSANISGATGQNYIPTSGGSYKLIITDSHGCTSTSSSLSITEYIHQVPTITGSSTICQGSNTSLSTGTTYSAYTWSTGSHSPSITVSSAGTYSVTITDGNGCVSTSANKNVTVSPLPTPTITAQGAISFCDGGNVVLDAGSGYSSYKWSNNKTTQTINPTASETFTVTVTNANGCSATTLPVVVTEWILPNPVVTSVGPTTYCLDEGTYFTTLPGYSYQWLKGTANVNGGTNQDYTPTSTATYKVKIIDTHGCNKTSSIGLKATVNTLPTASISVTTSTNLCNGATVKLTEATQTGNLYQWRKNSLNISGAILSTYTASVAGDYSCRVTKTTGCTATSNTITVTSNCKDEEMNDIGEGASLLVYPNPATQELHIRLNLPDQESGSGFLELRNMLGEVVYRSELTFENHQIAADVKLDSKLTAGVYFVIVRQDEKLYRSQFVIAKQ